MSTSNLGDNLSQSTSSLSGWSIPPYRLEPELYKLTRPEDYLGRFLDQGVRLDGRGIPGKSGPSYKGKGKTREREDASAWRSMTINTGSISSASGSSLIRLGQTMVVCGVQAQIATPIWNEPGHGFIVPNIELGPLCHSKYKSGPPPDEAQILSWRLFEVLTAGQRSFLPLDALCIEPGKAVWSIGISIVCVNDDGNLFDAALAAAVSALVDTRIPPVQYIPATEKVVTVSSDRHILPLVLDNLPLSFTFNLFDHSTLLPDPTDFEQDLAQASLCITLCGHQAGQAATVLKMEQSGPWSCTGTTQLELIQSCISQAKERYTVVARTIHDAANPTT